MVEKRHAWLHTRRLRFGAFELDTAAVELFYRGNRVQIQEMPLRVLGILLERPGELIRREEFFERLWPDDALGLLDGNLNMAVYKLRQALDDHPEHPAYIETVPRKGYRLLATVEPLPELRTSSTKDEPVRPEAQPSTARRVRSLASAGALLALVAGTLWLFFTAPKDDSLLQAGAVQRSIAVLPFADMSPDGDQAYFAEGLAEEILNLLARNRELRVTARTSSFGFQGKDVSIPEIGQTLGVAHVLEGSVRTTGDRVRVTAQLIETDTGFHVWSDTFDHTLDDIFAIQDEIAAAITRELKVSMASDRAHRTRNPDAYALYLQADHLLAQDGLESLQRASELIDRTLDLDPDYAPALAISARLRLRLVHPERAFIESRLLLERALELDPWLADAHAGLGQLAIRRGDFRGARRYLARALEINPSHHDANHWHAYALDMQGYLRETIAARQHFAKIDPLFVPNLYSLALRLADSGNLQESVLLSRRMQVDFPDHAEGHLAEAYTLLYQCRLADASMQVEMGRGIAPGHPQLRYLETLLYRRLGEYDLGESEIDYLAVIAPIVRGETELGLDRGWKLVAATPESRVAALALLDGLSLTGRHDELLAWIDRRWGGYDGVASYFSIFAMGRPYVPVAVAQKAAGRTDELAVTLAQIRAHVDLLQLHGHNNVGLNSVALAQHALAGERKDFVNLLTSSIDAGWCEPLLADWPWFVPWRDDPDVQALVGQMMTAVNQERARVGLVPLS